jgi:hypothetical protein
MNFEREICNNSMVDEFRECMQTTQNHPHHQFLRVLLCVVYHALMPIKTELG